MKIDQAADSQATSRNSYKFKAFSIALLGCIMASAAQGAPIFVPNFSFQNPDFLGDFGIGTNGSGNTVTVPGWTTNEVFGVMTFYVIDAGESQFVGAGGDNAALPGTAEGGQAAVIDAGGAGSLTTTAAVATTQANTLYSLTVALGDDLHTADQPGTVSIELLINGLSVALASITGAALPNGTFTDLSTSFLAPIDGQNLSIRLSQMTMGTTAFAWFDNVRLEQTPIIQVAEPMSIALIAIGLMSVAAVRRSKRRS